ncbi:hypothetical protein HAHE_17350 [Haloferula helveola]|uniref:FAS1 domain-containing protein n=1 Tax=Haloferula helveola TaxID=490095 RepID=A0ABM7REU4_9BACT|nr:hypothetical protein HAHE_17350 [Haloferula helveola]
MKTSLKFLFAGVTATALSLPSAIAGEEEKAEAKPKMDIVETAASVETFSTLVAAVKAADLVEALKGDGPFTVFAPTDDAFAALPEGTVETLLKPENKGKLVDILTYHVVAGKVPASEAVKLSEATALNKKAIALKVTDGKLMLNESATVVKTDIMTTNGVIHVIDAVILPPSEE